MPSKISEPISSELARIDKLIRAGNGAEAQQTLEKLTKDKLPRNDLTAASALAWRCNRPLIGIRLLNPIVRPSHRRPNEATDTERIEYAACLIKIGATDEALKLLASIESKTYPRRLLIEAFGYISQWRYQSALPLLTKYIASPGVTRYDKTVGKVNLAEALIHERHDQQALSLLRELLHDSSAQRLNLVLGKVLELSAQYWIFKKKYSEAEAYLDKAQKQLNESQSLDSFFVRKWRGLMEYSSQKGKGEAKAKLDVIRAEALERSHFETIRDCDRFEAILTKEEPLAQKLFFGTPFESFRDQLQADWGKELNGETHFLWQLRPEEAKRPSLDLFEISPSFALELKPGQLLHRLLSTLCRDFYRPFRVATLHSYLYPAEFFNPTSSPARIHEAVKRLRNWLEKHKLGVDIEEDTGTYRLSANKPFSIKVPSPSQPQTKSSSFLKIVRDQWPDRGFTVNELSKVLECSPRTALTYVKEAESEGTVVREGQGPKTKYRLAA